MIGLEIIALSLTAEYKGIGSEDNFFRVLPPYFTGKIAGMGYIAAKT